MKRALFVALLIAEAALGALFGCWLFVKWVGR